MAVGKAEWKKWDFKWRWNVVRVSQERTWVGRLFQIVGAAERKPRASNEMLQRVTDRRLAEADRRVLNGMCHWTRLAKYGGLPVCIALWVIVAILNYLYNWLFDWVTVCVAVLTKVKWICSFISMFCAVTAFAVVCIHGGTLNVGLKAHSPCVLVRQRIYHRRKSKIFFPCIYTVSIHAKGGHFEHLLWLKGTHIITLVC